MTDERALAIATGIIRASPDLIRQAWQQLHDTGVASAIGGRIAETEALLLERGMIERKGDDVAGQL